MAGVRHWQTGRFDMYRVNPPLVRLVAVVPLMLAGSTVDYPDDRSGWEVPEYEATAGRPEYSIGAAFIERNRDKAFWLFTLARWCCLPFSIVGGLACYLWGRDLFGNTAGLLALSMWCFMPDILGHGQLMTTDVPGAALGVAAGYTFWRWLKTSNWREAVTAGLVLGVAQLTKTTMVVLFGLWPLLFLLWHVCRPRSTPRGVLFRDIRQLVAILALAIYVLNLGYGFAGTFRPLGEYRFVSSSLTGAGSDGGSTSGNRFTGSLLCRLPVPLPTDYVLGIDEQRCSFERPNQWSFLRYQWREKGWWYYYLYAALIRMPLGYWALAGLSLAAGLVARRQPLWSVRDQMAVVVPLLVLLLVVSSQTEFSRHFRYALPVFPFLFVWTSRVAHPAVLRRTAFSLLVAAGIAFSVASSLWAYPHSLSYFNELIGGPRQGYLHLSGSNIDWGQDLFYLERWYKSHPEARPLGLAHSFPWIDPSIVGIEWYTPPLGANLEAGGGQRVLVDAGPKPGWYVLSVNRIIERSGRYEYFRLFTPVDRIAYSMPPQQNSWVGFAWETLKNT